MGIFDIFGGGSDDQQVQPRPDLPYKSGQNLYGWAQDYEKKYPYDPAKPYAGTLTAPRTDTQGMGQDILQQHLKSPQPQMFSTTEKMLGDTISGGYDPRTSPYYTAMKQQIERDQKEAIEAAYSGAASTGMLHSDPLQIRKQKAATEATGQIANLIGGLYDKERDRMMQAAPFGMELGRMQENLPVTRATAAETIGGAPVQHEQAGLDRIYNEYLRQVEGSREPLNIYEGMTSRRFDPYDPQVVPGQSGAGDLGSLTSTILSGNPLSMLKGLFG